MITIKVRMKRGGCLRLEAAGRCLIDRDGAGQRFEVVEDLELYWPPKKRDKKLYPVRFELVEDMRQVEEAFWEATKARGEQW